MDKIPRRCRKWTKITGKISGFDMLMTSSRAGYAEKASKDDTAILGKAMESCGQNDASGVVGCTINVLVGLR